MDVPADVIHSLKVSSENYNHISHFQIKKIIDIKNNLRMVKAQGQAIEHWNTLLMYILTNKLNHSTKKDWESSNNVRSVQWTHENTTLKGGKEQQCKCAFICCY